MKKLSKINLGQLHKNDMADREMNQLRGGNNCGCNCRFDDLTEQSVRVQFMNSLGLKAIMMMTVQFVLGKEVTAFTAVVKCLSKGA